MTILKCPNCNVSISLNPEIKRTEEKETKPIIRSEVTLEQELALVHEPPSWESIEKTRKMIEKLSKRSAK